MIQKASDIGSETHSRILESRKNKNILDSRILEEDTAGNRESKDNKRRIRETDSMADYLVEKLQSPEHRPAFLRAAWRLPQATILRILEIALVKGKPPRAYFLASIKREKEYGNAK